MAHQRRCLWVACVLALAVCSPRSEVSAMLGLPPEPLSMWDTWLFQDGDEFHLCLPPEPAGFHVEHVGPRGVEGPGALDAAAADPDEGAEGGVGRAADAHGDDGEDRRPQAPGPRAAEPRASRLTEEQESWCPSPC